MKPRYKIGMLVRVQHGETEETHIITGIVTRAHGYCYESDTGTFQEEEVTAAYREIKPRTTRTKKTTKRMSTNAKARARMTEETEFPDSREQ